MYLSVKDYLVHKVAITAFVGVHFQIGIEVSVGGEL